MLSIGIELQGILISFPKRILHPRLKCSRQAEINGEREVPVSLAGADRSSRVGGPIIYNDIINERSILFEILYRRNDIVLFIVGRYHSKNLILSLLGQTRPALVYYRSG